MQLGCCALAPCGSARHKAPLCELHDTVQEGPLSSCNLLYSVALPSEGYWLQHSCLYWSA